MTEGQFTLPYLAGFFDGEGSIGVYRNGRRASGGRTLRAQITQSATTESTVLLTAFQSRWGGSLALFNKRAVRPAWNYQSTGSNAAQMLLEIRPWLWVKAEQADIALKWWSERPRVRPRGSDGRILALPPHVAAADQAVELALKTAKRTVLQNEDVDVVIADAPDLVEVRHTLRQIVNVKGE